MRRALVRGLVDALAGRLTGLVAPIALVVALATWPLASWAAPAPAYTTTHPGKADWLGLATPQRRYEIELATASMASAQT